MLTTMQKVSIWTMAAIMAAFVGMTAVPANAQIDTELDTFQATTGLGDNDLRATIGDIVQVILGFLGILAVLIVLWAGFLWMTATGNEDQVGKAKSILIAGIIGLLIILSAYAVTAFVLQEFGDATGTTFTGL